MHYSQLFVPLNAVSFSFEPHSDQLLKGSSFSTVVRIAPLSDAIELDPWAPLTFLWRPENQATADRLVIQPDSPGVYRATIPEVRTNAQYGALFNGFQSASRGVTVLDPPVLRSFRVRLDYPRYTGLPPKLQEEFVGDIAALPGTSVTLTGISSNDLALAQVLFS
ncbi:MAG: hypothetical protein IH628_03440, partial [Proteobacteria bacterium]|nr:hypothetical protein [Pseudomonadota bacterium]